MMSRSLATGGSGVRGEDGKQRGTVNFSLAFAITNTTESQPYGRQLHPHTKDRILNSRLESVSWHSLATVAQQSAPLQAVPSVQYAVSSVEWRQVQPGQCPCELGKHFHWFSWLELAWFWASHSKRVENAFAARLTATSAIESICQAVSLSPSLLPLTLFSCSLSPFLSLSACVPLPVCWDKRCNPVEMELFTFNCTHAVATWGWRGAGEGGLWVDVAR